MNPEIDNYLLVGCGRCELGGTPQCKVHSWQNELEQLRLIVLSTPLKEELKWKVPCYTYQNKNICIVSAFKDYCAISFFKGALLKDVKNILTSPGENSQAARLIRFTSVKEIIRLSQAIKAYIQEAIELEKVGAKIEYKNISEYAIPEEFQEILSKNKALRQAFDALTPGRQRGYLLHFTQPKQSKTRIDRIEKCIDKIFSGKGVNEY